MSSFSTLIDGSCARAPRGQAWQDFVNFRLTGRREITHFTWAIKRNSTLLGLLLIVVAGLVPATPD